MKKNIIYTDAEIYNDEAREEYQEEMREINNDPDYEVTDDEWYDHCALWIDDERCNLNKEIDGVIIAFANIGRWNGRVQGYKIMGSNVRNILESGSDDNEWFGDGNNIRSTQAHHDGTNYILYRVAKDMDAAEKIASQIYHNEIDEAQFRKKTRSLYPYVANIYGWSTKKFKKKTA